MGVLVDIGVGVAVLVAVGEGLGERFGEGWIDFSTLGGVVLTDEPSILFVSFDPEMAKPITTKTKTNTHAPQPIPIFFFVEDAIEHLSILQIVYL